MSLHIIITIFEHFYEDAQGRDGHGHASESKETLYYKFFTKISYHDQNIYFIKLSSLILLEIINKRISLFEKVCRIYFNQNSKKDY